MRKNRRVIAIVIALCVIGFFLTVADFLALHDIQREYVSSQILESLGIALSEDLPRWTATKGEWAIVRISFYFRLCFFILCAVLLYETSNRRGARDQMMG